MRYDQTRYITQKIDRFEPKECKELVVVITGNGKGKTTAALRIALRA